MSAKFLSFPAESKNEDGGQKLKTCQKFFQNPEPGLHRVSYTKMSSVLSDQIEEGLNLPKPFGTAETRQEHGGGQVSDQAYDHHVDYFKSGQRGHSLSMASVKTLTER